MRPWSIEECKAYAQQLRDKTRASTAEHAAQAIEYLLGLVQPTQEWQWHQAPIKTEWGEDMVVASVSIDKNHTVDLYCERSQTDKVEAMFTQQPVQEPVLEVRCFGEKRVFVTLVPVEKFNDGDRLYTAPQPRQWQGLTEEEIIDQFQTNVDTGSLLSFTDGARYAEAKLKEKNT